MYSTEHQLHNDEKLFLLSWFELYYNVINQISLGWSDSSIMEIHMFSGPTNTACVTDVIQFLNRLFFLI